MNPNCLDAASSPNTLATAATQIAHCATREVCTSSLKMDWKCDSCLFVNHFAVERCELCEDPKDRLLVLRKRRAMKPYEDRVDELIMVSNMLSEQTRTLAKLTVSNRSAFSAAYAAILSAAVAAPSSGVAVFTTRLLLSLLMMPVILLPPTWVWGKGM